MRLPILLVLACVFLIVALTDGQEQGGNGDGEVAETNRRLGENPNRIANGTARPRRTPGENRNRTARRRRRQKRKNESKKNKREKKRKNSGHGKKRTRKNRKQQRLRRLKNRKTPIKSTGLIGSLLSPGLTSGLFGTSKLSGLIKSLVGRNGFFGQGSRLLKQVIRLTRLRGLV